MNDPVIVYLADKRNRLDKVGWYRFDCLCASLKTVKLFLPPLPIVIFHEDFEVQDEEHIRTLVDDVAFACVDFSGQEQYYINCCPGFRVGIYSYSMMCRFFSGIMQSHPLVASHSHYMRLDDDNYFVAPVLPQPIEYALTHDYTFCAYFDEHRRELYRFTLDFMKREGLSRKHVPKYTTGHSPYTNFHISSLAMWRNPVVVKYLDAIEAVHGCVAKGWTDSSIQYMITILLGPPLGLTVQREHNIPYRHNQHCVHPGPHTEYCLDGRGEQLNWGPPSCLMQGKQA